LIFNFSTLFDGKVNLVGALGKSKFLVIFKSAGKNKKNQGKTGIFTQNRFLTKSILIFGVILKQMIVNTCNFHRMFILAFFIHNTILKLLI